MAAPEIRRILHCDMDCFYAAVEMRDDPTLAGRPVVVGGDPRGRGVVAAASYEARRFGIHSAMPAAQALRRCPEVVFIRPDFPRYRRESQAIFSIYRDFTPVLQPMSLDEAYLDLTGRLGAFPSATVVAHEIRRRVRQERGLTVSVGVAPNKLLAKIASDYRKPDGLTVVKPGEVEVFLAPLPVRRLHGVGPSATEALAAMGVTTVADLRALSLDRLLGRFGHWGRTLWQYARGMDERPVRTHEPRRSLSAEQTFGTDLRSLEAVDGVLGTLAREVADGLVRRDLAGLTVTVKVRYADFTTLTRSRTLAAPTASASVLEAAARELVRRTEAGRRPVRLLGVGASNLVPAVLEPLPLFESPGEMGADTANHKDTEERSPSPPEFS